MTRYLVVLIDETAIEVTAADELDAVLAAGGELEQDVAHLVMDVEPLELVA